MLHFANSPDGSTPPAATMNALSSLPREFFAAPHFPDDLLRTRKAVVFNLSLWSVAGMTSVALIGALVFGRPSGSILLIPSAFVLLCVALHRLAHHGHLDLSALLLVSSMFAAVTATVAMLGSIRAPVAGYYVAMVVLAGLMWGRNGVLLAAACASLAYATLMLGESRGLLPDVDPTLSTTMWVVATSLFACVGWMSYAAHEVIDRALSQTEQEVRDRRLAEAALAQSNAELREALASVRTLSGLLPMCAWCKKIRDDDGYWRTLEAYIESRTDASVSHALCASCHDQHFRDVVRTP